MIINDEVFGELEYDGYDWIKKEKDKFTFFGKDFEINLTLKGEKDKNIEEVKKNTYIKYKKNEKEIISQMEDAIYNYYQEICEELREQYENYKDEWAPIITAKEEVANLITLLDVIIDKNFENSEDREINFIFDAVWDIEEGLGIRLINEKIAIIDAQCVVLCN